MNRGVLHRAAIFSIKCFLFLRLLTSLVVLAAILWIPPQIQPPEAASVQAYLAPLEKGGPFIQYFIAPWYRWDTVHYLEIADHGYASKPVNTIWPPLYPLLTRLASILFTPSLLAALVVSNLAAILAWTLLYLWAADVWDEKIARDSVLWAVVFPTAFLWMAGYSESLFLVLAVGCVYAFRKSRWILAGLAGAGAILTRWQGIILFVPLGWLWFQAVFIQKRMTFRQAMPMLIPPILMAVAGVGFLLYVRIGSGYSMPWETISNWSQHFALPWEGFAGTLESLLSPSGDVVSAIGHFFDLLISGGAIALLIAQYRRIPTEYILYAAAGIFLTITKVDNLSQLTDASRYVLGVFPLFAALALTLKKWGKAAWFAFALLSLVVLTILFFEWAWMA